MSKKLRKYSITSHSSNESINSIDSRAYSTDRTISTGTSGSIEKELNKLDDTFDNSCNLFKKTNKCQFRFRPISLRRPVRKRRPRDQGINQKEKNPTPVVNYDYLNFVEYIDLENSSENEKK